ncbi:MAG: hypothetical protein FWC71_08485 [Defluviitaleaceae bacterium]|nr:hypothetical protein [Defluviitaleaceae bacterium]
MKKGRFYRWQRGGTLFYVISLWFLAILGFASFVSPVVIIYIEQHILQQPPNWNEIIAGTLLTKIFAAFFLGVFFYLKIKSGRRRKKMFAKFEQLPADEQAEINTELSGKVCTKYGQAYLGNKRLYIRSPWCLEFVDYKDAAWIYFSNATLSAFMPMDAKNLHIYDIEGMRFKLQLFGYTKESIEEIITLLKTHNPNLLFGYSEARHKRAKQDFNAFISEEIAAGRTLHNMTGGNR